MANTQLSKANGTSAVPNPNPAAAFVGNPTAGVSLYQTIKAQHPDFTEDQIKAVIAVGAVNIAPGSMVAATTRSGSRFTRAKKPQRERFDATSYYALQALSTVGTNEDEDKPIQVGFTRHAPGTTNDKGQDMTAYNGNITLLGFGGRAHVFTPASMDALCQAAPTIRKWLDKHEAAIRSALESRDAS